MAKRNLLQGQRWELDINDEAFPDALRQIERPPHKLYAIGNIEALKEGLAVVGARKATPYGLSCARLFAGIAAQRGIVIISGGARGCDAQAHEAALEQQAPTCVFLGGGCDEVYPVENRGLFQRVINAGGVVVSEQPWDYKPLPFAFRERNRLIAGLARATLIVEAGLPSGTFSTADEALAANRDVLVVPGAITSERSRGANRLIYQGATPIVDEDTFQDQLFSLFGCLRQEQVMSSDSSTPSGIEAVLFDALRAQPLTLEALNQLVYEHTKGAVTQSWLMIWLAQSQQAGFIAQYPDGRYGPVVRRI